MEQKNLFKNISGTVCVLGIALSTMNGNSTMVVNGNYKLPEVSRSYYDDGNFSSSFDMKISNFYEQKSFSTLETEANSLFGIMRDATPEEQASVNKYIKSISKDTGVNFFDLC